MLAVLGICRVALPIGEKYTCLCLCLVCKYSKTKSVSVGVRDALFTQL